MTTVDNRITAQGEAAVVAGGDADLTVRGDSLRTSRVAVRAEGRSSVSVTESDIAEVEVAIVFSGQSTGSTEGNACELSDHGIVLLDGAHSELGDDDCAAVDQRSE